MLFMLLHVKKKKKEGLSCLTPPDTKKSFIMFNILSLLPRLDLFFFDSLPNRKLVPVSEN